MNDEIKEILDRLKEDLYIPMEDNREYKLLDKGDDKLLLDCITNLEQENERLNNIINELEKWLEDNIEYGDDDYYDMKASGVESALNKLKELKEGK